MTTGEAFEPRQTLHLLTLAWSLNALFHNVRSPMIPQDVSPPSSWSGPLGHPSSWSVRLLRPGPRGTAEVRNNAGWQHYRKHNACRFKLFTFARRRRVSKLTSCPEPSLRFLEKLLVTSSHCSPDQSDCELGGKQEKETCLYNATLCLRGKSLSGRLNHTHDSERKYMINKC